jgi:DNA-binding HxlR family transcriptional regulator
MQARVDYVYLQYKSQIKEDMNEPNESNLNRRSNCPIACTLDLIGDKWTILIVRDMFFFGKCRFEDFLDSPEKISTNILTARLKKMEESGLITKNPYGTHSQRMDYKLTQKGSSLAEIVRQITVWGKENIPDTKTNLLEEDLIL